MRTPRILVVENDQELAQGIRASLEAVGYEVAAASDGASALQKARLIRPDLGLLDVQLPGDMDGVQTGDVIHTELDIPVVFLTGQADGQARATSSYGYVAKPVRDDALIPVIELALHRHRMERVLALSERRFRLLFQKNPAGVVVETTDGRIVECNQALAALLGYASPEELRGQAAAALFHDPHESLDRRQRVAAGETVSNEETTLRHKQGHPVWIVDNAVLVPDPMTGRGQILRTVLDISERKQMEQGLERLAYRDALTGLPNRRLLEMRADQTLADAYRRGEHAALVFLDLIGFKKVNDEMGHQVGDELIVKVARRLESSLRRTDSAARFGGDEFVVLLSAVEDREATEGAARRLLDHVARPIELNGHAFEVTARAGIALYPDQGQDLAGLMELADRALTRAKALGGSVIVFAHTTRERLEQD